MIINNDFDLGNAFRTIYDLMISLIKGIGDIWDWLFDTHVIFGGLSFNIFEWHIVLIPKFDFTPIQALSIVGLTSLIAFWIIKALVPLG